MVSYYAALVAEHSYSFTFEQRHVFVHSLVAQKYLFLCGINRTAECEKH